MTMSRFPVHSIETAPAGSREGLQAARARFGFVPNLLGMLAGSPAALGAYLGVTEAFGAGTLTEVERQVVLLTVSHHHECHYCMAAHSAGATMAGIAPEVLEALRRGEPLPDARLEALRRTTDRLVTSRGWISQEETGAFLAAGFTEAQLLEVIAGIALKTISNYANHLAGTPLDAPFAKFAWTKPEPATAGQPVR